MTDHSDLGYNWIMMEHSMETSNAAPALVDNYASTFTELAAFIRENAPEGARQQDLDNITRYSYVSVTVRRYFDPTDPDHSPDADATVLADVKRLTAERFDDAEGNIWVSYDLHFDVSWPAYGTSSSSNALAVTAFRARVIADAVQFAQRLQERFGGRAVHSLVMTKAERDAADAKRKADEEARTLQVDLRTLVEANNSRMKVGAKRYDYRASIPDGRYTVQAGVPTKTYTVDASRGTVTIIRTA